MITQRLRPVMAGFALMLLASGCAGHGAYMNEGPTQLGKSPW